MNWKNIRLELAATGGFPHGSPSRAYHLRLPLDATGLVDRGAYGRNPKQATVRRFWASEPDLYGFVEPNSDGWQFHWSKGGGSDAAVHLPSQPLIQDGEVTVHEADGTELRFRVARVTNPRQAVSTAK